MGFSLGEGDLYLFESLQTWYRFKVDYLESLVALHLIVSRLSSHFVILSYRHRVSAHSSSVHYNPAGKLRFMSGHLMAKDRFVLIARDHSSFVDESRQDLLKPFDWSAMGISSHQ